MKHNILNHPDNSMKTSAIDWEVVLFWLCTVIAIGRVVVRLVGGV